MARDGRRAVLRQEYMQAGQDLRVRKMVLLLDI